MKNISNSYCITYTLKQIECELCKAVLPDALKHDNEIYDIWDFIKPSFKNYMILETCSDQNLQTNKTIYILNFDEKSSLRLGRSNDSDVKISDISVSRYHCIFKIWENGEISILDNKSKFGSLILLNHPYMPIYYKPNLALQIGRSTFKIHLKYPCFLIKLFTCWKPKDLVRDYCIINSEYISREDILNIKIQNDKNSFQSSEKSKILNNNIHNSCIQNQLVVEKKESEINLNKKPKKLSGSMSSNKINIKNGELDLLHGGISNNNLNNDSSNNNNELNQINNQHLITDNNNNNNLNDIDNNEENSRYECNTSHNNQIYSPTNKDDIIQLPAIVTSNNVNNNYNIINKNVSRNFIHKEEINEYINEINNRIKAKGFNKEDFKVSLPEYDLNLSSHENKVNNNVYNIINSNRNRNNLNINNNPIEDNYMQHYHYEEIERFKKMQLISDFMNKSNSVTQINDPNNLNIFNNNKHRNSEGIYNDSGKKDYLGSGSNYVNNHPNINIPNLFGLESIKNEISNNNPNSNTNHIINQYYSRKKSNNSNDIYLDHKHKSLIYEIGKNFKLNEDPCNFNIARVISPVISYKTRRSGHPRRKSTKIKSPKKLINKIYDEDQIKPSLSPQKIYFSPNNLKRIKIHPSELLLNAPNNNNNIFNINNQAIKNPNEI